jgi:molybdenum cofactor synthesis domain-containing protein
MKIAIITLSDRASEGVYADQSGPAVEVVLKPLFSDGVFFRETIPDDEGQLLAVLKKYIQENVDFIFTTGGTGIGPRDITPEVTRTVLDKEIPGIAEAIRAHSLVATSSAMLSRGVSGLAGQTLILNLPGSPRAVTDILTYLASLLQHAHLMIRGIDAH